MPIEFDEMAHPGQANIKVIGVGGGGGNAINTMIEAGLEGVEFITANTDCQVLETSLAPVKVHLGKTLTKGLGAGANPEIGRAAALEDAARVAESLAGADMVFVTAGMGGGTGTGAAPVIAQVARDMGALTVGVVTKPFVFEGTQRRKKAHGGISELAKCVDALIVIPNDKLIGIAGMKMTLRDAFASVDAVLLNAVRGISDLVTYPGLINVDFADVRAVMTGMGRALMGTGRGLGETRALDAAKMAITSPLLEDVSIEGATGILINITGGPDLTLAELNEAASLIHDAADPDANIIFGSVIDPNCGEEVRLTVIATGFRSSAEAERDAGASAGRGNAKRGVDQMALPMAAARQGAPSARIAELHSEPARAMRIEPEAMDVDDFETRSPSAVTAAPTSVVAAAAAVLPAAAPVSPVPLAPSSPQAAAAPAAGAVAAMAPAEWSGPATDVRPIIRPSVPAAAARRTSAPMPAVRTQADDLGVEDGELDRPTFVRRALIGPDSYDR